MIYRIHNRNEGSLNEGAGLDCRKFKHRMYAKHPFSTSTYPHVVKKGTVMSHLDAYIAPFTNATHSVSKSFSAIVHIGSDTNLLFCHPFHLKGSFKKRGGGLGFPKTIMPLENFTLGT